MSNITVTNNDLGGVAGAAMYQDDILTVAGAGDVLEGTILARDSSTGKLVPFVKGGTSNENGIPKAVLSYSVSAAAAGDIAVRALVSGTVYSNRLVISADGDNSNVDKVVVDQLRDYGIIAESVSELNYQDNQ